MRNAPLTISASPRIRGRLQDVCRRQEAGIEAAAIIVRRPRKRVRCRLAFHRSARGIKWPALLVRPPVSRPCERVLLRVFLQPSAAYWNPVSFSRTCSVALPKCLSLLKVSDRRIAFATRRRRQQCGEPVYATKTTKPDACPWQSVIGSPKKLIYGRIRQRRQKRPPGIIRDDTVNDPGRRGWQSRAKANSRRLPARRSPRVAGEAAGGAKGSVLVRTCLTPPSACRHKHGQGALLIIRSTVPGYLQVAVEVDEVRRYSANTECKVPKSGAVHQ
jgi:hypothetical protein